MKLLFAVLAMLLAYLVLWPVPIEPVAWDAPEAPALEGRFEINDRLADVRRVGSGVGVGPEDVEVDEAGNVFVGYEDGRIVRFSADHSQHALLAHTGGRPLGMALDR